MALKRALAILLAGFMLTAAHAAAAPSTIVIGAYYPGDSAALPDRIEKGV